ncbi:BlaI/MecI/CopY family transcriptional regulator, partial [Candidatus Pacearchaeota archaeon]|nr:BlaI/MecI/CopY family transcriptional regulator [Candidatus Pacearchaeota archaeon]
MQQLNPRQIKILEYIAKQKKASNANIISFLKNNVSRFTVLRDLDLLLQEGLIRKEGKGRAVNYLSLDSEINGF